MSVNPPFFCILALNGSTQHDFHLHRLLENSAFALAENRAGPLFWRRLLAPDHPQSSRGVSNIRCAAASVSSRAFRSQKMKKRLCHCNGSGAFFGGTSLVGPGGRRSRNGATVRRQDPHQFGIKIVPPRAGAGPLTFDAALLAQFGDLTGISVRCGGELARPVSTKRCCSPTGLERPAILQISSLLAEGSRHHQRHGRRGRDVLAN